MINVKRSVVATFSAVAMIGMSCVLAAQPASAAVSCGPWTDGTTFGGTCHTSSLPYFRAAAKCTGDTIDRVGSWARSGGSSYVYCSTWGKKYVAGSGHFQYSQKGS